MSTAQEAQDGKAVHALKTAAKTLPALAFLLMLAVAPASTSALPQAGTDDAMPPMPCDMFADAAAYGYSQVSEDSLGASLAWQDAMDWCLPMGGVPPFTTGEIFFEDILHELDEAPEGFEVDPIHLPEVKGPQLPGVDPGRWIEVNPQVPDLGGSWKKCHAYSPDTGTETIVCAIGCGWRLASAHYHVDMEATAALDDGPTIYAGVGCFGSGFLHVPPVGVACGNFEAFACEADYAEGQRMSWGSCVFSAEGVRPSITDAHCSWKRQPSDE